MAIYHCSVKTISRSAGRSATASAAYRAATSIVDTTTGECHDYTAKQGVISTHLLLPDGAPEWGRAELWNAAEAAETRKNSTVAREIVLALPDELSPGERQRLVLDFAREIVARHGCAVDIAIHAPNKEGDQRNHHAHLLMTTRRLTADGLAEKTREWDGGKQGKETVEHWRERWSGLANERLAQAGQTARIDHRSHAERGVLSTPGVHLGPAASGYERRTGEPSRRRESQQRQQSQQQPTGPQRVDALMRAFDWKQRLKRRQEEEQRRRLDEQRRIEQQRREEQRLAEQKRLEEQRAAVQAEKPQQPPPPPPRSRGWSM